MLNKKTIVVDKYQMTYLESETKSGTLTPVLFLHGWALSPQSFQPGLELISNQRKVIAPDIFSFKKANNSHDKWKYEDYAEALSNLLDVLQIKEVHIMGHSLGGGISIVFSAIYPSKVQSIVLIDSTGIPLGNFLKVLGGRFIELTLQAWKTQFSVFHGEMILAFYKNLTFRPRITINALKLPLYVDLSEYMEAINDPCLLIWGSEDLLTPLRLGKEINARIRNSKLTIIERAYHEWSVLMPRTFAKLVVDYLSSVAPLQR